MLTQKIVIDQTRDGVYYILFLRDLDSTIHLVGSAGVAEVLTEVL